MMTEHVSDVPCPLCEQAPLETVKQVPFFRGYVVVFQHGHKRFAGCVSCVRKQMLLECLKAVTFGWLSPKALVCTVVETPVTFCRALMLGRDDKSVVRFLDELAIPTNNHDDRLRESIYGIAAAIIMADGQTHPSEIEIAEEYLSTILPKYERSELMRYIGEWNKSKSVLASAQFLNRFVSDEGRQVLLEMFLNIAFADGVGEKRERKQWNAFAGAMGLSRNESKKLWDAFVEMPA